MEQSIFAVVILVVLVGLALFFFVITKRKEEESAQEESTQEEQVWQHTDVFQKKTFLFDSVSEFKFFKVLVELFGDKYYIFPQINLSHLVEPKGKSFYQHRKNRSRIEKKSVDFVLCDKERVVPCLVIELDGPTHARESRVKRDIFVNELMKNIEMPLLRIKTGNLEKLFLKAEVEKALKVASG